MKKSILYFVAIVFAGSVFTLSSCKKTPEPATPDPGSSKIELLSLKTTSAPTIDGIVDDVWANAQLLEGTVTVPSAGADALNPGQDVFQFYVGESTTYTMRSLYDNSNIYILLQWKDSKDSKDRMAWYFEPATKLWAQQNKFPDSPTDKWYEDKAAFMWNINQVAGWSTSTCYATCHTGVDPSPQGKSARHYTFNPGELIDIWHWKRVRTNVDHQLDDKHMIHELTGHGREGDTKISGGYASNEQTLNNGDADVSVPKYIIPGKTDYYWITQKEIDDGTAKLITGVDTNGVLSYTGGTIDPSIGGFEKNTGNKRAPSVTTAPFLGPRGDVTAYGTWNNGEWTLEIKRSLTNDNTSQDIQFDLSKEFFFGFSIFNNAAIGHMIKTNLVLKFK